MDVARPLSTRSESRRSKASRSVNVVSTRSPSRLILISEILAARACEARKKKSRSVSFALIKEESLAFLACQAASPADKPSPPLAGPSLPRPLSPSLPPFRPGEVGDSQDSETQGSEVGV